jgi:hypothetical protein
VERQWVQWDGGGGSIYYDEDGFMIEEGKRQIFDIGVTAKGKVLFWDENDGSLGFFSGYDSGPYTVKRTPEGHIMIANGTENTENYNFFVLEDTTPYYTRRRIYSYSYDPILYGEHPQIFKDSYGYYWGDRSGKGMPLTALATPITFEGYRFLGIVLNGKKFPINGQEQDGYDNTQHFMDDVMQGKACTLPIVRMNNAGTAEDFAKVDVRGKIAVVDRGEISFWIKLQNASEAGAIAVFCANNQPGTVNANLSELPSSVKKIPFLTITQDQGATLNGKTEASFVIAPVPFYASGE